MTNVPEERVVLSVGYDVEGVAQYLDALGIVPETLKEIGAAIDRTEIGSVTAFRQKGAQLAQALAAGYQASMRGALEGGVTPADFALRSIGGDAFTRQLQGQADAALQYAHALQVLNEAAARARILGNPAFQPLTAGGGPGAALAGPNVAARQQVDVARARQFEDRLQNTMDRLAAAIGAQPHITWSPEGVIQAGTQSLAQPLDLPNAREESQLRRQAEQEAIATNRAILDALNTRRQRQGPGMGTAPEVFAETIEAQLGAHNAARFFRGRELPVGVGRRLNAETRQELFGTEEMVRGTKVRGPGFVTPADVFQDLLEERGRAANPGAMLRTPPELQTAAAAELDMAEAMARDRQAHRSRVHRAELAELTERMSNLTETLASTRRYRGVQQRAALPTPEAFEGAASALQSLAAAPRLPRGLPAGAGDLFEQALGPQVRQPQERMVTVYRGNEEPLDLSRIRPEGLPITTQRSYAEEYGGKKYLYSAQMPESVLAESPFAESGRLPHGYLTPEQAAMLRPIVQPEPGPLPRITETPDRAEPKVGQLARAIDDLGDEAGETARELQRVMVAGRQGTQALPVGGAGAVLPGAGLVPTVETQAERNLRARQAFEGVFPREDIAAGQALRAQLLAGGGPRALTAGTGVLGGAAVPFAGSVLPGFPQGPGLPPGGRPPGPMFGPEPPPRYGTAPGLDFDQGAEDAKARARGKRSAREFFEETDPRDEQARIDEEAARRRRAAEQERDRADKQWQASQRERARANADNARWEANQGGFGQRMRTAFTQDPTGQGRTVGERFKTGLFASRGGDLVEGIGQTARFSVLYGLAYSALFQVSQAIAAVTQEAIAYEDALVSLQQATGRSRGELGGLAETLSESAARSGLAPSVGVEVGARAIGLFGVNQASAAVQEQTAETATRVATQIARVTGGDPKQVITEMAGTLRSLGLGAQSAPELQDILTFIGRQTGRGIGDLLPAISNVGTLGKAAGFSTEELAASIAQVSSTTGQTPNAVAGSFRQVLSRADDPAFNAKVGAMFGFDATGMNLNQIFQEVAATGPDSQQVSRFSQLFGRGGSQTVAQILTTEQGRIAGLATGAGAAAGTGIGAEDFEKVRGTIGGEIQALGTNLLELGQDLIDSGIVDSLALVVKTLNIVVNAVDSVVDAFNIIPRPLRSIAFALGELYLAARLLAGGRILQSVLGAAGGGGLGGAAASGAAPLIQGMTRGADGVYRMAGGLAAGRVGQVLTTPVGQALGQGLGAGLGAIRGIPSSFAAAGGVRGLAAGGVEFAGAARTAIAGSAVTPVALAAASALIAHQLVVSAQRATQIRERLGAAEEAFGGATTADELKEAAATARETRDFAGKRVALGAGNLLFGTGEQEDAAENVRKEAKRQADEVERQQRRATAGRGTPEAAFGGFESVEGVTAGLKALSDNGYTAAQRLSALNNAFDAMNSKTAQGADTVATLFAGQGGEFTSAIGRASTRALVGGTSGQLRLEARGATPVTSFMGGVGQLLAPLAAPFDSGNRMADLRAPLDFAANFGGALLPGDQGTGREKQIKFDEAADQLDQINLKKLAKRSGDAALETLKRRGKDPALGVVELDQGDIGAINKAVFGVAEESLGPALKGLDKKTREHILRTYAGSQATQVRGVLGDFSGGAVDPGTVQAFLVNATQEAQLAGQQKGLETGDTLLGAGTNLGALRTARDKATESLNNAKLSKGQRDSIYRLIAQFDLQILAAEDATMAERTQRAQALADLDKSQLGVDDTIGRRAIDLQTLRGALGRTRDKNEQLRLQAQINETEQQQALDIQATGGATALAGIDPRRNIARTRQQLENARGRLALLSPESAQTAQTQEEIANLEQQLRQQTVDRINSQIGAGVAGQDSGLVQARAAIEQAENNLGIQIKGTQGYYDALAALRNAQRQLANAELQAASIKQQLEGDITDPVEAARDAVADATRKLRADRASGQGKDVIGADRVALQQARAGQEDAAFQQQFGDMQFADQMGDISHQSYIRYLRNTLTHLTEQQDGMKKTDDGYRATTERIQQVRSALKATVDSMDAMWNLGDIKVPTPFEVRRSLATEGNQASATGGEGFLTSLITAVNGQTGGVNISINGADVGKVRAIIGEYLGPQATGRGKKRRGA